MQNIAVLQADERRVLLVEAANRMRISPVIMEKDF
jgi:hypothetical protein